MKNRFIDYRRSHNGMAGVLHRGCFRRVIAIDFDGVLSLGKFPQCGPANHEMIRLLKRLIAAPSPTRPFYILWTSRTGSYLDDAVEWLQKLGLKFDFVNKQPYETPKNYTRKILADLYVDDRAMGPKEFIAKYAVVVQAQAHVSRRGGEHRP
jgi:hypothetical protein